MSFGGFSALYDHKIGYEALSRMTGMHGTILSREGEVLYDGREIDGQDCMQNVVVGNVYGAAIYSSYPKELSPSEFPRWKGIHVIGDRKDNVLETTLISREAHAELAKYYGYRSPSSVDHEGCVFAYNYKTGEVYVCLSLPALEPAKDGKNTMAPNRCSQILYDPGSTMKYVTTLCALQQFPGLGDPESEDYMVHDCHGVEALSTGEEIWDNAVHGTCDLTRATRQSCNSFFVELLHRMDVDQTRKALEAMNFLPKRQPGAGDPSDPMIPMGDMRRMPSYMDYRSADCFEDVWGMIGEISSRVTPIQMAMIAGAASNGGQAVHPYMVSKWINLTTGQETQYGPDAVDQMFPAETAETAVEIWKNATDMGYRGEGGLSPAITYAKTGTNEEGQEKDTNFRMLLGSIEQYDTAFFIVIENVDMTTEEERGNVKQMLMNIANELAVQLSVHLENETAD